MSSMKETMIRVIQEQPEDATYEEILRELAFHKMVERGLGDSREGRVISNEEMSRRMDEWRK
jgi:predicted transcriptional regulator